MSSDDAKPDPHERVGQNNAFLKRHVPGYRAHAGSAGSGSPS